MQPRLTDNPRDWLKFTAAVCIVMAGMIILFWRRRLIAPQFVGLLLGGVAILLIVCAIKPAWFRSFYRGGMILSFYIGQVVGRILLLAVFLAVVTPLGLLLKLLGKDLLALKKASSADSYWKLPKGTRSLDRQF